MLLADRREKLLERPDETNAKANLIKRRIRRFVASGSRDETSDFCRKQAYAKSLAMTHTPCEAQILIGSPNQVEAITANFEKREPKFGDVEN